MAATSQRRVALITGCGKRNGLGAAIARQLSGDGVAVAVCDVAPAGIANKTGDGSSQDGADWQGLSSLIDELTAAGGQAAMFLGDVGSEADTERLVADTVHRFGRLDILVNNAGAPLGEEDHNDIERLGLAAWETVMRINATGAFLMARAAVPHMRRQGWGRIVSMSSIAANTGHPHTLVYAASKAAILGFTRALAVDVAKDGITVNAVCPGLTLTSRAIASARLDADGDEAATLAKRAKQFPAGRIAEAHEVAAVVGFLASDAASWVTAQAITVDGGLTNTARF